MATRDPVGFLRSEYEQLGSNELDWRLRTLEGPSTPRCTVDGKKVIMLCSNNYLSLSNHPKVKQAAIEALQKYGAVHLSAVGGAGALLSKHIVAAEIIAYEDLGTEALRKLQVVDFPAIVAYDSHGNTVYGLPQSGVLKQ